MQKRSFSKKESMIDFIEKNITEKQDDVAYHFVNYSDQPDVRISFLMLYKKLLIISGYLQKNQYMNKPVILILPDESDFVVGFFGALLSGAIAVPTNVVHFKSRYLDRFISIINDTGADLIITHSSKVQALTDWMSTTSSLTKKLQIIAIDKIDEGYKDLFRPHDIGHDNIAFLQYTSGSTGNPKGVMVTHGNILVNSFIISQTFNTSSSSIICGWLPLYHDMGLIGHVMQPFCVGAQSIIMPASQFIRKPLRWLDMISRHAVTVSGAPNFAYDFCVEKIPEKDLVDIDLSTWEIAYNGSEQVHFASMRKFYSKFKNVGFRMNSFRPCYGLAEATLMVSGSRDTQLTSNYFLRDKLAQREMVLTNQKSELKTEVSSLGGIHESYQVAIVDPETHQRCLPNQIGEIWLSGPSIAQGYWKNKSLTRETFECQLPDCEKLYLRTGDLGAIYENNLFITSRLKETIIIHGINYYPAEIEMVVENLHESFLTHSGVVVDILTDEGNKILVLQEIRKSFINKVDFFDLSKKIYSELLAQYGIGVFDIVFLRPASIPKTTSGKIKRLAAKQAYIAGNFKPLYNLIKDHSKKCSTEHVSHNDSNKLSMLIGQILPNSTMILPSTYINELGLDSLQLAQLVYGIEKEYDINCDEFDFLDYTIESLHLSLEKKSRQQNRDLDVPKAFVNKYEKLALSRPADQGYFDLSLSQRAVWSISKIDRLHRVYNVCFAIQFKHLITVDFLLKSLLFLQKEQPILSAKFILKKEYLYQYIDAHKPINLTIVDGSFMSVSEINCYLENEADKEITEESGDLVRYILVQKNKDDMQSSVLSIVSHHAIFDYYSIELFIYRVIELYKKAQSAIEMNAMQAKFQFHIDYLQWEQNMLLSDNSQKIKDKIQTKLKQYGTKLNFPIDKPRTASRNFTAGQLEKSFDQSISNAIKELCKDYRVTPYVYFLSIFQLLIHTICRESKLILGTPTLGRSCADAMNAIGNFANPVLIFSDQYNIAKFSDFIISTNRNVKEAMLAKDIPYSWLVSNLDFSRDASRSPLIQAMFVWHATNHKFSSSDYQVLPLRGLRGAPDELTCMLRDDHGLFSFSLNYNSDLFLPETINIISDIFIHLVESSLESDFKINDNDDVNSIVNQLNDKKYIDTYLCNQLKLKDEIDDCIAINEVNQLGETYKIYYVVVNTERYGINEVEDLMSKNLHKELLPDYVVPIAAIPYTSNGVIDYAALAILPKINKKTLHTVHKFILNKNNNLKLDSRLVEKKSHRKMPNLNLPVVSKFKNDTVSKGSMKKALICNDTLRYQLPFENLIDGFLNTVQKNPQKGIFLITDESLNPDFISYQDLFDKAKNVLANLREYNLEKSNYVILQIDDLRVYFPVFWACILGGIIPITVAPVMHYHDDDMMTKKLFHTFDLHDRPYIIASDSIKEIICKADDRFNPCLIGTSDILKQTYKEVAIDMNNAGVVAFCQLSSGSTGASKSIQMKHQSIIQFINSTIQANNYEDKDVTCNWLPMDHVVPLLTFHLKDTLLGCNQIEVTNKLILNNPLIWLSIIEKFKVTHTWSPNFGYKLINDSFKKNPDLAFDLSSIKYFMNAGEQTTHVVINDFINNIRRCGGQSFQMQTAYGMAEMCTIVVSVNNFSVKQHIVGLSEYSFSKPIRFSDNSNKGVTSIISQGKAYPGISIRICDQDNIMLHENEIGRVQVLGKTMTLGYYNNIEANSKAFLDDGWYNTGDLGFISKEELYITGREKELIIINGVNYYCYDIEDAIGDIEEVDSTCVAVLGIVDELLGTEKLIVLYCKNKEKFTTLELTHSKIMKVVARQFGLSVGDILMLEPHQFQKTTSGKVQRDAMKMHYLKHKKDGDLSYTLQDLIFQPMWAQQDRLDCSVNISPNSLVLIISNSEKIPQKILNLFQKINCSGFVLNRKELFETKKIHGLLKRFCNSVSKSVYIIDDLFELSDRVDNNRMRLMDEVSESVDHIIKIFKELGDNNQFFDTFDYVLLTHMAFSVLQEDNLNIFSSLLPAFVKALSAELKLVSAKILDFDSIYTDCENDIFNELSMGNHSQSQNIVAFRNKLRFLPKLVPLENEFTSKKLSNANSLLNTDFIVLIGGFGGVGCHLLDYLLSYTSANILVVGRRKLDELISQQVSYKEFFESGKLHYTSVDITNHLLFQEMWLKFNNKVSQSVVTVFNLVGNMDIAPLSDLDANRFCTAVRDKYIGTINLGEILANLDCKIKLVNFSSVNGFYPGVFSAAYSAVNAFCDQYQNNLNRYDNIDCYTLAWSFWQDTGMSKDLAQQKFAEKKGFMPITNAIGIMVLHLISEYPSGCYLIGLDPENINTTRYQFSQIKSLTSINISYKNQLEDQDLYNLLKTISIKDNFQNSLNETIIFSKAKKELKDVGYIEEQDEDNSKRQLVSKIRMIWSASLNKDDYTNDANFFEIGGNSIQAIQIVAELEKLVNKPIDIIELFNYPSINKLAEYLAQNCNTRGQELENVTTRDRRKSRKRGLAILKEAEQV